MCEANECGLDSEMTIFLGCVYGTKGHPGTIAPNAPSSSGLECYGWHDDLAAQLDPSFRQGFLQEFTETAMREKKSVIDFAGSIFCEFP